MKQQTVRNIHEYIDWSAASGLAYDVTLFRGQSVQGGLLPSIARKNPGYDSHQLERTVLDQFKLMGASMLSAAWGSLELMVIAQHYGLQTRLLDWTGNALAALYFACASSRPGDVFVYSLQADSLIAKDAYEKDPFVSPKTSVFQPPLNNPRIIAQQGWFTLHRYSKSSSRFVALEKNAETKDHLSEALVPASARTEMLDYLARNGVTSHSLFPDLTGLAQYLNRKYKLT